MARYVVYRISDGLVVNIVEWDGNVLTWTPPPGTATVQKNTEGNIGDTYNVGTDTFTPPPPIPPPPSPIRVVTAAMSPYTVVDTDESLFVDSTGGHVIVSLPPDPAHGRLVNVKKVSTDMNNFTVDGNGKSIDGASSITSAAINRPNLQMLYDSANNDWRVL